MHEVILTIPVAPPFRVEFTVWLLRRREKNTMDRWDGRSYSRVLVVDGVPTKLTASQAGIAKQPQLSVTIQSHESLSLSQCAYVQATMQKMLGLAVDLQPFYVLAQRSPELDRLAKRFIGVRPPRFPSVFEALVNAIACQQLSLDVGILLLNRLSETFGVAYPDDGDIVYAFPGPEDLADISEERFRQLGFSYQKARSIKDLAYRMLHEELHLEQLEFVSNEQALICLQSIRGIGRWSAEYVLLRGLGRLDMFPGDDIGGQNNLQKLLRLTTRPDYGQLKKLTSVWQPYTGFVYFHLLLGGLYEKQLQ